MKYTVKLPKILCLILLLYKHVKNVKYYNTNDLIKLANDLKPELVRLRNDKDEGDYKFLEDTNFGGLRGNFSTLLTLKGLLKKNNNYTPYYALDQSERLFNSVQKGEIILDAANCCAYTQNEPLKTLLENVIKNFTIRENQAHLTAFLKRNINFPLKRDTVNFPKQGILKSYNDKYFMRVLFNTFKNSNIIEFSMLNYLAGAKIKVHNIHPLFIIPSYEDSWENFWVIDGREVLLRTPLFIYFDKQKQQFVDKDDYIYRHYNLDEGIEKLSDQTGNIDERFSYDWNLTKAKLVEDIEISPKNIRQSEYSEFLENFLQWKREFSILGKRVVEITESSSPGSDVKLKFAGGTTQNIELEHKWNNYILHKHYKDRAWKGCWLYADETWNFDRIKAIFSPYLKQYNECIPEIFLCVNPDTKKKEAYEVKWDTLTFNKLDIKD